jgi:hypothetical protein
MICCGSISDKSTDTWKTGLELHEDDQTTFSSYSSKFDNQYQVLAIIGDNSEEFDDNNNPVLNPTNVTIGANHLAEGDTTKSLTTRAKIWLSADEWNTIKVAIEHDTTIPGDASIHRAQYMIRRRGRSMRLKGNRCGMHRPLLTFRLRTSNLLWEVLCWLVHHGILLRAFLLNS